MDYSDAQIRAGIASVPLVADPASWINRRVETIEILSHEETRRRVSVDFTLDGEQQENLTTPQGLLVPISVLTKEPRRNFDLRCESGAAVPVLGRQSNGELSHIAVLQAALEALAGEITPEAFELLESDLAEIVLSPPDQAETALGYFIGGAESGDSLRSSVWEDDVCRNLLETLWANYVLFAVLSPSSDNRRILKYSYATTSLGLKREVCANGLLQPTSLTPFGSRTGPTSSSSVQAPGERGAFTWRSRSQRNFAWRLRLSST